MILYDKDLNIPMFSENEYKRRWENIRRRMIPRQIDCLIIVGNSVDTIDLEYMTGVAMENKEGYCIFPLFGDSSLLICHDIEMEPARHVSFVPEIKQVEPSALDQKFSFSFGGPVSNILKKIKDLGLEKGTLGIDSAGNIPYGVYTRLKKELPQANFVDAGEIIYASSVIKNNAELEFVRKAHEAAEKGFLAMVNIARPGITDNELRGACLGAIYSAGANPGMFFLTTQWPRNIPLHGEAYPFREREVSINCKKVMLF